jgi:alcohol dehydrogenase (NADP+)
VVAVGEHVKKFQAGDTAEVGCMVDSCRTCANCEEDLEQFCDATTFTYNSPDKHTGGTTFGGYSDSIVVDVAILPKLVYQQNRFP